MSKIQFIHRRPICTTQGDFASRGGMTVAYRPGDGFVEYSIAHCSSKDNFNKKLGRGIATGRLLVGSGRQIIEMNEEQFRDYMFGMPV